MGSWLIGNEGDGKNLVLHIIITTIIAITKTP
jgi:hypothetical protein